ncbi:unnamed protein product [Urochloa decumbens]|uniref:F-box domain-containing protein n=1 Tax=Urochloa decumbens TaxID=240449 RepID=A0ABC9CWW1_9POAL
MESPGKRKRFNDAGGAAGYLFGDRDRLSVLPDCLLREIMSHMKARQVVQTCVLSRRWRHLWRSMPCLDVDYKEFEAPGATYLDYESWEKFEDFMDTLLSPGNVSIALLDTLRLRSSWGIGRGPGSRWIRRGIKYPHVGDEDPGVLRGTTLSYNSWRLRRLHLSHIDLSNLFAEHVRTRCQSLEDLELQSCRFDFQGIIASISLKNLVLKSCMLMGLSEIATPALKNLVIDRGSNFKERQLVITAPALVSVFLGVSIAIFSGGLSVCDNKIVDRFKILGSGVSNMITNLEVAFSQKMELGEGSTVIQFNNLRTLVLNRCDLSDDYQILGYFLRNSPNMERLTLVFCKYSDDTKKKKGPNKSKHAESTPPCPNLVDAPCENLKLTEIIYEEDDIRQLIDLLLRISGNLPNNRIKFTKFS